jgi:hypothetical protein
LANKGFFKGGFFSWSMALRKMLIMNNLRNQHVIVVDRCCMCRRNGESVDHLLFHCEASGALWNAFFNCFRLSWVMHTRIIDLYACWWTVGSTRSAVVCKMVSSCLLWCIWGEMNDKSFEDHKRTMRSLSFLSSILFICRQLLMFLLWF